MQMFSFLKWFEKMLKINIPSDIVKVLNVKLFGILCPWHTHLESDFLELCSRKTVCLSEQTMSMNRYLNKFAC